MTRLEPTMRLKVKGDTFFLPDPDGSVYFRNNSGSLCLEGKSVDQWIEKLIPVFNGEHTLEDLTDGLPEPYRDRVYEIAGILYKNGFIRDVSQDRPHQLSEAVLKNFASQIEFLDSFSNSGAYRFQSYRQAKVLAVGSGSFFVSLVAALWESGLPNIHFLLTDGMATNRKRLAELMNDARIRDSQVALEEISLQKKDVSFWREVVQPFDGILYVSQTGDLEELRVLHGVCREEKKVLLPALFLKQVGLAGPLVHPESEGCWESAWRRLHQTVLDKDPQRHTFSSTAGALLANVIVFEWFKTVTGVIQAEGKNQFFLLNLETLEGNWHVFLPHPLVTRGVTAQWIHDLDRRMEQDFAGNGLNQLLSFFSRLTSAESGIFHLWEEGDLKQLPLAQCRVQTADPLSEGPAELLPEIVCAGLTHEEARREAGLAGMEGYASRFTSFAVSTLEGKPIEPKEFVGIGAGVRVAEGVCRGLQKCLAEELRKQLKDQAPAVYPVPLHVIEDEGCQFYLQALTTLQGTPMIGWGEEVAGFPVVWVGTKDRWYGSVGLHVTSALRQALQEALLKTQNQGVCLAGQTLEVSSVILREKEKKPMMNLVFQEMGHEEILQSALQILKRKGKEVLIFELALEPVLKEERVGVFGVVLRGGESY